MNDLAAAIDHAAACHERALDRMTEAGIPLAEAIEMLHDFRTAYADLRAASTLHSQREAFRASLTKSPEEA